MRILQSHGYLHRRNFPTVVPSFLGTQATQRSWHWALPSLNNLTSPAPHSLSLSDQHLLIRFLTLVRSLLHQQLTLSHSLLAPLTLTRNMKLKKLTAIMAAVSSGAATVLTATGTAPYYGNASMLGTAVINPYVFSFPCSYLFCRLASLPFHHTPHQHLAPKEPMSTIPSDNIILTRVLEQWIHWTPQTTTPHPAE
ncbi:hypothetical protein Q7P36_003615 [Cladosporium allicinum]